MARRLFVFLIFLCVLRPEAVNAQDAPFDPDAYYRAVDYCGRNLMANRMWLSPDRQILCFNSDLAKNMDVYLAKDLKDDGLFIVRSPGGYAQPAMELADILRERHATVVVFDYCFSACANFLLIASYRTYVLKGALVLWHNSPGDDLCTYLSEPHEGGPRKVLRAQCGYEGFDGRWPVFAGFLKQRAVDPNMAFPPDTLYTRKMLSYRYQGYLQSGVWHDVLWTIHPRYLPRLFKTKIVYEAYPESEEELDRILARLHMTNARVIYDP